MGKRQRRREREAGMRPEGNRAKTLKLEKKKVVGMVPLSISKDEAISPGGVVMVDDVPVKFEGERIGTVLKAEVTPGGVEVEMEIDKEI